MIKKIPVSLRLVGFVLLTVSMWLLGSAPAQAATPLLPEPNNYGGGIPTFRRNYLEFCNGGVGGPSVTTWMSPRNQGSAPLAITVPSGTTSIDLQFNDAGAVCSASNRGAGYANYVDTVGPGVNGLLNRINAYNFPNYQQPGSYGYSNTNAQANFTYAPVGGFTASGTYRVSATARSIIRSVNPGNPDVYNCVVNGAPVGAWNAFLDCPQEDVSFDIVVTVQNEAVGRIEGGSCDIGSFTSTDRGSVTSTTQAAIIGWAKDADYDFTQVHVYIDGIDPNNLGNLTLVGSYDANRYPRSLNGVDIWAAQGRTPYGTGVPDWHNWFVVPKTDMDRFADAYTHNVRIFAIGRNADGSTNGDNREIFKPDGTRQRIGPCAQVTCTVTTNPAPPEVGIPFSINLNYVYNNAGAQGRPITPIANVSFNAGSPQTFTFAPTRTSGSRTFSPFQQNSPGTFTINGSVSQPGAYNVSCNDNNVRVASRPYVKVYGNDVAVGGKFADDTDTNCTAGPTPTTPAASIWAFDKKVNANGESYYGGASGQFGVSALGKIDNFASAGARNGLNAPKPATGLSFGNMINNNLVADYGGESPLHRCIPNYFSASTNPGADLRNGNTHINQVAPIVLNNNDHRAIFVNGDAYIDNDVNMANTTWNNPNSIPSFYLIVKGNIYIDDSVNNLNGVYIAQPDDAGNKGIIYTCTNSATRYRADELYTNCREKLTITGSFIAKQVKYLRVNGTVGTSIPDGPAANLQRGFAWNSAGEIPGQVCVKWEEGSDPNTWFDNFLCSQNDYGLRFSPNLPIPGMTCINLNKPAPYPVSYTWYDNYLCWPPAQNLQLTWHPNGDDPSKYCTPIVEVGPWGTDTYLCEPRVAQPAYTPVNEPASSPNIAEAFNFSQELYLAPVPSVLQSVVGTRGTTDKPRYESITSLPPVL